MNVVFGFFLCGKCHKNDYLRNERFQVIWVEGIFIKNAASCTNASFVEVLSR